MKDKLALDYAECLKGIENLGHTVWQNVCDGTQVVVPWGSMDWLGFFALCLAVFVAVVLSFLMLTDR